MRVLVVNSGSSSIKYRLYDMPAETLLAGGSITGIGGDASGVRDHDEGFGLLFGRLEAGSLPAPDAIGHRVVHGGAAFSAPVVIDDAVYAAIEACSRLAPLHNPPSLAGIAAARRSQPRVPHVAVFDTAFHHDLPDVAATYALPRTLPRGGQLRRYGFHGTNCAWCLAAAAQFLGRPAADLNLVVAHLGAGASITAVRGGRSVDTSMGFTPLEGLVMQTRSGDVDPGLLLYLLQEGLTRDELDRMLNHESGIRGLCGEGDMRTVAQRSDAGDPEARFARDVYAYRVCKYVGAYAGVAWPLDALVFTGGVGENDAGIRAAVAAGLGHLGIAIDPAANARGGEDVRDIAAPDSKVRVLVIPANEELQIARETAALLGRA